MKFKKSYVVTALILEGLIAGLLLYGYAARPTLDTFGDRCLPFWHMTLDLGILFVAHSAVIGATAFFLFQQEYRRKVRGLTLALLVIAISSLLWFLALRLIDNRYTVGDCRIVSFAAILRQS